MKSSPFYHHFAKGGWLVALVEYNENIGAFELKKEIELKEYDI